VTSTEAERLARAALGYVAEPGDEDMGALLRVCAPAEILAALAEGRMPASAAAENDEGEDAGFLGRDRPSRRAGPLAACTAPDAAAAGSVSNLRLERGLRRWSARLGDVPPDLTLDAWHRAGIRFLIPGDPEWPGQLSVLGDTQPWGLWMRGDTDLRYACLRSVAVVGTRAATAYGAHICTELAIALAERGWTVVSGGAYGIDSCAHRGAVAVGGTTIAVLPCGVDMTYPPGNWELFRHIREHGALVSEWPPGRHPTRHGFLVRNRVIAALSRGTVVVEAALRSGALNTARHAHDQARPLMAMPGPVTSAQSAGCHEALRELAAVCVTGARDVVEVLDFCEDGPAEAPRGPVLPRDLLDPVTSRVLDAVPVRAGWGPARIAVKAGVEFDTVMSCLGALAATGFVERCDRGWRLRRVPKMSDDGPSM